MGPPLDSPDRQRVPWQGLLLTVSLLTLWNPPATAQVSVESVPLNAVEGKHVLLLVHNLPQDTIGYIWHKGDRTDSSYSIASYVIDTKTNITGPAYSGRETVYPNGSLLFQHATLKDTGYYTLQLIRKNLQNEQVTGQLRVYSELPKPSITSNSSSPVEDEDSVALTCEPETQDTTYLWWIDGQRLQGSDRLVTSLDNRTLILIFITRNDTGSYQCENRNPVSGSRSDPVNLNVLYGPDVPTISPPDSYYPPGANLHLSCHAASNPPARYSWLINGSLQIPTQELFVPSITVSHSGFYACVAYNSATGRNRTTIKNITVSAKENAPGVLVGAIAGIVIGVLAGVTLVAALGCVLFLRRTGRASGQRDLREQQPPKSTSGPAPSNRGTPSVPQPDPRTASPTYEELLHPDTNVYGRINHRADVAS
uniref:Ig-like domain-containing protein n=1 Tax=Microcebus murinus TaxID=30608 RepID=A0A8B7WU61_MICMU|nr:carcinoembryonic antigen-related cell adhesion molecule 6 isoform X2 [Microcebus murinus]